MDNKNKKKKKLLPWLLLIPAILPIFMVLIIGLIDALITSLGWLPIIDQYTLTLDAYRDLLSNQDIIKSLFYSVLIAGISATLAVVIGSLGAYSLTQVNKKWIYRLGVAISSLGVLLPYAVVAQSTQLLFSQSGLLARLSYQIGLISQPTDFPILLNTPFSLGLFWPFIVKGSAFAIIIILPIYREIKTKLEPEARTLGAHGINLWLRIYHASAAKPLALIGGIMFAFAFGGIEIPLWLGALKPKMLSIHYYHLFQHPDLTMLTERMALVIIMAIVGLIATLLYGLMIMTLSERLKLPIKTKAKSIQQYAKANNRKMLFYVSIILIPIIWLVYRGIFSPIYYPDLLPSTGNGLVQFVDTFKEPLLGKSLDNSVIVSLLTGAYIAIAAIPAGRAFSKYTDFKGRRFAMLICLIPLVIPAIVTITGTIQTSIKLGIYGSHIAVALCHVVMTLPYAIGIQAMYQIRLGQQFEASARTLGATSWQYLTRIHLPLILPPIVLSFSVGFLISFTETFSTQLVGAGNITTLGALMAPTLEYGDITRGSAYMIIFLIINGLLFIASNNYAKKWTRKPQADLKLEEQFDKR